MKGYVKTRVHAVSAMTVDLEEEEEEGERARKVVVRCGEKLIGAALEVLHRARQVGIGTKQPDVSISFNVSKR